MNIIHIINLFRAYLIESQKRLLISCLATFGGVAFGFVVDADLKIILSTPYVVLFFLTCLTIFGFKKNRMNFFILPSRAIEKFIYAIVTIIFLGIVYYLFSLAGAYTGHYFIRPLLYSSASYYVSCGMDILNASIWSWESYLKFVIPLPIFLFGSIYFKKNAFLKTIGVGVGVLFGIALYTFALFYITFGEMMNGNHQYHNSININLTDHPFFQTHWYVIPIAVIVFFLSLTYLRLRETEV